MQCVKICFHRIFIEFSSSQSSAKAEVSTEENPSYSAPQGEPNKEPTISLSSPAATEDEDVYEQVDVN